MKFTSPITKEEYDQLKKQGSIPVKKGDKIIGKSYIDEKGKFIIEIYEVDE